MFKCMVCGEEMPKNDSGSMITNTIAHWDCWGQNTGTDIGGAVDRMKKDGVINIYHQFVKNGQYELARTMFKEFLERDDV